MEKLSYQKTSWHGIVLNTVKKNLSAQADHVREN